MANLEDDALLAEMVGEMLEEYRMDGEAELTKHVGELPPVEFTENASAAVVLGALRRAESEELQQLHWAAKHLREAVRRRLSRQRIEREIARREFVTKGGPPVLVGMVTDYGRSPLVVRMTWDEEKGFALEEVPINWHST